MKILTLGAALALLAMPASAQMGKSAATQKFVYKAAISDMYEVEVSKLALEKSSNSAIRQFAQEMVDDHTKTTEELKSIAQKIQGLELPSRMDVERENQLNRLKSAAAAQFDQRYRRQQFEGHQHAVSLFQDYANRGDNAELKFWAEKTLPHLRQHLQEARALPQSPVASRQQQLGAQTAQAGQAQKGGRQVAPLAAPGPDHMLASQLRGKRVYGVNNENVGDVNDLLLDRNGRAVALIVGVGGFLGIGEKDVAVPIEAVEIVDDKRSDGSGTTGAGSQQPQGTTKADRIVLRGMSKEDLNAAPKFRADAGTDRDDGNPQRNTAPRQ